MYLASKSPQRKALLQSAGIDFELILPEYSEEGLADDPALFVESHSRGKALSVVPRMGEDFWPGSALQRGRPILGVDTMVVVDGEPLGKAADAEEALSFIRRISGRTHQVYSGVTFIGASSGHSAEPPDRHPGERASASDEGSAFSYDGRELNQRTSHAITEVRFATIPEPEIELYIAIGEWKERAGAYAIQGLASAFVEEIHGDYTNVVGLPVPLLVCLLREAGHWPPPGWGRAGDE